jgi:hypothetical protein
VRKSATKIARPVAPSPEPSARMFRSCVRGAKNKLSNRNGNVAAPPSAIKLPAANGLQRNGPAPGAPNTGRFASHAPSTKKHVNANQHIVNETPHCGKLIRVRGGGVERVGRNVSPVVTVTITSRGGVCWVGALVDTSESSMGCSVLAGSWYHFATQIQNTVHTPAIIQAMLEGLNELKSKRWMTPYPVYPLSTLFSKPRR